MAIKSIDFNVWISQQQLANELNVSIQRVHNWVKREKIEHIKIPEFNNATFVNRNTLKLTPKYKSV